MHKIFRILLTSSVIVLMGCMTHGASMRIPFPSLNDPVKSSTDQRSYSLKMKGKLPVPNQAEANAALPCHPKSRMVGNNIEIAGNTFKENGDWVFNSNAYWLALKQTTGISQLDSQPYLLHYKGKGGIIVKYNWVDSREPTNLETILPHLAGAARGPLKVIKSNGVPVIAFFETRGSDMKYMGSRNIYNFWIFRQYGEAMLQAIGYWGDDPQVSQEQRYSALSASLICFMP